MRLGKIYTDMPLAHDQPIRFGVKRILRRLPALRRRLPGQGHSHRARRRPSVYNQSNHQGRAQVDRRRREVLQLLGGPEQRLLHLHSRLSLQQRLQQAHHRLGRRLAGTPLRRFMLWLDVKLGYGKRHKPKQLVGAHVVQGKSSGPGLVQNPRGCPPGEHISQPLRRCLKAGCIQNALTAHIPGKGQEFSLNPTSYDPFPECTAKFSSFETASPRAPHPALACTTTIVSRLQHSPNEISARIW